MKKDTQMTRSMDVNLRLPDINNTSMSNINDGSARKDIDYVKDKNAIKMAVNTPRHD